MECLDEETILAFGRGGGLSAYARDRAQEHIGTCDECRQLVSAVARSSFADVPSNEDQGPTASDVRSVAGGYTTRDVDPEEREDRPRGPLLRSRLDPAMAPTTPVGGAGSSGPMAAPVQAGQVLAGKFEVERVLGHGGMGIVVAARHTQLDQRVALKFLLPVACEVPGAVARFLREGKAAARITSEHVARVMDTGVLDGGDIPGAPYLVMEYLEGSDLGGLLEQRGRIRPDEAMEYVLQACEAIVEAHDLGIVHRDLKPANLFLSRRADGSPLVKVLDFGISKVEGGGSRSQLTSASVLMGSPRYMSPEQMMSARDVDARTDVWALGVILYELVTGKPVWTADTVQGLCALIATTPAPALREALPTAPAALEDAIARCLVKSREGRLASIADLALALAPIAPASARTSIERILRVAGRERELGTAAAAPAAHAEAGVILGELRTPGVPLAPGATTNRTDRTAQTRVGLVLGVGVAVLLVVGVAINATLAERTPSAQGEVGASSALADPAVTPRVVPSATAATAPTALGPAAAPSSAADSSPVEEQTPPSASVVRRPLRSPPRAATTKPAISASAPAAQAGVVPKRPDPSPVPREPSRALTDRK